jgi:hypothetical protein
MTIKKPLPPNVRCTNRKRLQTKLFPTSRPPLERNAAQGWVIGLVIAYIWQALPSPLKIALRSSVEALIALTVRNEDTLANFLTMAGMLIFDFYGQCFISHHPLLPMATHPQITVRWCSWVSRIGPVRSAVAIASNNSISCFQNKSDKPASQLDLLQWTSILQSVGAMTTTAMTCLLPMLKGIGTTGWISLIHVSYNLVGGAAYL